MKFAQGILGSVMLFRAFKKWGVISRANEFLIFFLALIFALLNFATGRGRLDRGEAIHACVLLGG